MESMYVVYINDKVNECKDIDSAISFASSMIYANYETKMNAKYQLENKKTAQWIYGFSNVMIVPK